jgi:hypothetical protein
MNANMDTNMNTLIDNVCAVCPRPGKLCSVCKDIYYCCRSHQKDDWPTHKLVCKKLCGKQRYPGTVFALHFPVDVTEPEFTSLASDCGLPVWYSSTFLHSKSLQVNGCSSTCSCEFNTYDSRFTSSSSHSPLCRFIYINAPDQEDDPIIRNKDLKVNRCIELLTGDTSWKAPVVAYAMNLKKKPVDMGMSGFGKILDAFRDVRGVRINCDGIVDAKIAPQFEAVTIKSYYLRGAAYDYLWNRPRDLSASFLTRHTGIVLQDRRESDAESPNNFRLDEERLDEDNSTARLLSIPCNIHEPNFGYFSRLCNTGNVIVVREDRKPLDINYLEILCDWIDEDLLPLFKQARLDCTGIDRQKSSIDDPTSQKRAIRQRVLERITKQNLLAYSGGKLKVEDTEDTEGEEVEDVVENQDTTDDEMPELGEGFEASDGDEDKL